MKAYKRVLLLTPSMSKGGAETQLLKLALFLRSKSHQVLIISLKPIDEFNEILTQSGVDVIFLQNWSGHLFSNIGTLYRRIKKFRPDVTVAFMFAAIVFARLLKLGLKFKLISSIRISVIPDKWYIPFKITSGIDDAVVYNSFASKRNFEGKKLGLKNGIVINNGVAIPQLISFNGISYPKDIFRWICIGHFRWNKDYLTLFKAIALIKEHNFRVDIIGQLHRDSWLYKVIEDYQIRDQVNILGFQQDTYSWLLQSHAFILSSFSEGMSNAVLEAMACGKIVLVTDIDGNRELIRECNCGLLCEQRNEYDMAAKMLEIMGMSAKERDLVGGKGKRHIEENFEEERVMDCWMQLIEKVTS